MSRIAILVRRFGRDEDGAALVEFAVVVLLFLFVLFSLIDFGRLGGSVVMAEKAAQIAARTAVVRPPACSGVPKTHERGPSTSMLRFGTSCRTEAGVCLNPGTISCPGDAGNATASEIWNRIRPLLGPDAEITNLTFTYAYDETLGFLGGPYTPMVTVEITPKFDFVFPLSAMAAELGGGTGFDDTTHTGPFSVTLPAEDLAQGTAG